MRQRPLLIAADLHGTPARVLAPHRSAFIGSPGGLPFLSRPNCDARVLWLYFGSLPPARLARRWRPTPDLAGDDRLAQDPQGDGPARPQAFGRAGRGRRDLLSARPSRAGRDEALWARAWSPGRSRPAAPRPGAAASDASGWKPCPTARPLASRAFSAKTWRGRPPSSPTAGRVMPGSPPPARSRAHPPRPLLGRCRPAPARHPPRLRSRQALVRWTPSVGPLERRS